MLEDIEILNGKLSPKFISSNTVYSIILNDINDRQLDFNYKIKNSDNIEVINNDLIGDMSKVLIVVYNDHERMTYTFYVYKKEDLIASEDLNLFVPLETEVKAMPNYIIPTIACSCFLIIIILFSILFHHKSKKSK